MHDLQSPRVLIDNYFHFHNVGLFECEKTQKVFLLPVLIFFVFVKIYNTRSFNNVFYMRYRISGYEISEEIHIFIEKANLLSVFCTNVLIMNL